MFGIKSVDQDLVLANDLFQGNSGFEVVEEKITETISVGQKLFKARKGLRKMSLEKISDELCIRPHLLMALEQGDFNKFPSACYAVGSLKNYAEYLGLDVVKIVSQYKKEFQGSNKKVDLVFLEVDQNNNSAQSLLVSLVILSVLVLFGVWYSMNNNNQMVLSSLPDVSEVTSNILVSYTEKDQPIMAVAEQEDPMGFHLVQQATAMSLSAEAQTTAIVADQVRLTVNEDTWVRIVSADQDILVDRILLADEEFYMTDRAGLKLMTSNAGAVAIYVGNVAVAPLGKAGEIRENISLDKADLLQNTTQ